ncbi:hypothetical protein [Crocosphaera sp.]|uniref:hypothetical protein n=1 Tax=Crocosphaera sp. TaxID=2729996 RepID=UPI0026035B7C|nr:hypothetical protein [Crocosphaera sp.]MDJ0582978.1 hypothetical protein [Crocosphaera sp.]
MIRVVHRLYSGNIGITDNIPSKFHRAIEYDTLNYKDRLQQLEVQKHELQAQLEASQRTNNYTQVVTNSPSVNNTSTKVTPVSSPRTTVVRSQPSIKIPTLPKLANVSSQRSVRINPVSTSQKISVPVAQKKKPPSPVSEVSVVPQTPATDLILTNHQSPAQELAKTAPKGFISPKDLGPIRFTQTQTAMIAPQAKTSMKKHITLANDLSVGLIVADNRNELKYGTRNYKKVQTAILSLRKGSSETLEEAAQRSGIDLKTLKWLAHYGQNRPGSFNPSQISMVQPD